MSNGTIAIIILILLVIIAFHNIDEIKTATENFRVNYPKFNVIPKGVWPSGFPYHVQNKNLTYNEKPCINTSTVGQCAASIAAGDNSCVNAAPEHTLAAVMPCYQCGIRTDPSLQNGESRDPTIPGPGVDDSIGTMWSPDNRLCMMGDIQATCGEFRAGLPPLELNKPIQIGDKYQPIVSEFDGVRSTDSPPGPNIYESLTKEIMKGKLPTERMAVPEDIYEY